MNEIRKKALRRTFQAVAFVSVGIAIVLLAAVAFIDKQDNHARLSDSSTRLKAVTAELNQQEARNATFAADRERILAVFQKCRQATDIPELDFPMIVSVFEDSDYCNFYVPEGTHRLHVEVRWRPEPPQVRPQDPGYEEVKEWEIPLIGNGGYRFAVDEGARLIRDGKLTGHHIGWKLTSHLEAFETKREIVLDGFDKSGGSWSSNSRFEFPNATSYRGWAKADKTIPPEPLVLMDPSFFGRVEDQRYKVRFKVRLHSDGPRTVSAPHAAWMDKQQRSEMKLHYSGQGMYIVQ